MELKKPCGPCGMIQVALYHQVYVLTVDTVSRLKTCQLVLWYCWLAL
jgi:hypothetical protein